MCDLYQIFVHVAYGRVSVLLRRVMKCQKEEAVLGLFFPTHDALYSTKFGTHTETAEPIEMLFAVMSGLGPRNSVLCGVMIP